MMPAPLTFDKYAMYRKYVLIGARLVSINKDLILMELDPTPGEKPWIEMALRLYSTSPNPDNIAIEYRGRIETEERTYHLHIITDGEVWYPIKQQCTTPTKSGRVWVVNTDNMDNCFPLPPHKKIIQKYIKEIVGQMDI